MTLLTLPELINIRNTVNSNIQTYYHNYKYIFDIYTSIGCRPLEPLTPNIWSINELDQVVLIPFKNNYPRIMSQKYFPDEFIEMIVSGWFNYDESRSKTIQRAFKMCNSVTQVRTLNDNVDSYIYRYIKVREMYANGETLEEIRAFFGWRTTAMVTRYLEKSLYSE